MSGRQGKPPLTVPKFSSFTPKQPEPPAPVIKEDKEDDSVDRKRHRHSRHEEHLSKRPRQESELRESRRHGESGRSESERGSRRVIEESQRRRDRSSGGRAEHHRRPSQAVQPQTVKSEHFFVDVKGDPLIIRYGGIERSKIPAYRRHGYGRVLGTPGRLLIHRDGARDQFSLVMPGESAAFKDKDGLRSKSGRARRNPILLRARKDGAAQVDDDGYLALGSSKRDRRLLKSDSESDEANTKPDYRSIEGKAKPNAGGVLDSESDSDESELEAEPPSLEQTNPLKWLSIQLSRHVKDQPEDTAAWIDLADHQDALLRAGERLDHQVLENEAHSYAEIKVSMLEKAILHATNPKLRLEALNYLMREGLKVWNSKTAEQKWSEIFKDERGDSFDLWKLYLDFSMSNMASFKVDYIKTMILDRLGRVAAHTGPDPIQAFGQAIYLFLRATKFLHDAGYREMAVAAWQAMLEMTFFRPAGLDGREAAMEAFEEFWESEVARIGEQDALGWRRFIESPGDAPEPAAYSPPEPEDTKDSYKAWANEERWQAQRAGLPARTLDHGNDDDPFRVVMFSDIAPFLFLIPDDCLSRLGSQLLDGFLIFLGLPPRSSGDEWTRMALQDPFLTIFDETALSHRREDDQQDVEVDKRTPNFAPAIMRAAITPELLFPDTEGGWFHSLPRKGQLASMSVELVKNVLAQLVQGKVPVVQDELALYYLSFTFLQDPTTIKKLARSLMKQNPTSLSLYNGYALVEHARGNNDVARTVFSSATELATKSASRSSTDELRLWSTWSWIELQLGSRNLAVKRLCSKVDAALRMTTDEDTAISPTCLLKAHQSFQGDFQHLCSTGDADGAALRVECLALLAYLTADGGTEPGSSTQGNISAAMLSIGSSIEELRSRQLVGGKAHERLVQSAARLLYLHASRGPYRRGYLREQLSSWIDDFPRNTILLCLLEWTDSGLRVVDETRSLLHDRVLIKHHDCVSSRVFAIEHELTRGNVNTTQVAYERAVTSDAGKHNACLWISYVRFCYAQRGMRARAKEVFYRALRHCPWSRGAMMEAFDSLIRVMESEELKSVFAMMTSKGLRAHVDLDEFLEARRAEKSGRTTP